MLGAALGCAVLLTVLELVLRLLPVQDGIAAADRNADWPIHHLIPNVHYTFSEGWDLRNVHRGVTNNMGYVAPFAYVPGSDAIAVVGNSFIEGQMNRYQDTLQGQLAQQVPNAPAILNFGVSGAALPYYIGLGPMVSHRYRLSWVVILVVGGDFVKGFTPMQGLFGWNAADMPPVELRPDHVRTALVKLGVARLVRSLAIVRYVRGNLWFDLRHFLHTSISGAPHTCVREDLHPGDAELVAGFADGLPAAYGLPPSRVILVFDADRKELYRSHGASTVSSCPTRDDAALSALAAAAAKRGEHVINMGPAFAAYYRATGQRLDYSPMDYHWNAVAHGLAAAAVARVINEAQSRPPRVLSVAAGADPRPGTGADQHASP